MALDVDLQPLIDRIDRVLPQTQCGQCGFSGCRPYAGALAAGEAGVDRCPPGGDVGARALAKVTGLPYKPYDRNRGLHKESPAVAVIVEEACIGCTKCIAACPVDAIIGGAKHMHVVIESLCTGCDLCIPACPVDCIVMLPRVDGAPSQSLTSIPPASSSRLSGCNSPS